MAMTDTATGQPLPESSIQRVLFAHHPIHIFSIPPLTSSTSGFKASTWTSPTQPSARQIFTARMRILETSNSSSNPLSATAIKCDILLEDPDSGELFAAAPYTSPFVVQSANDSSRFFAVRVVGERGMKATLGLGFEDRSVAFDFGIALGDARKVLGMEAQGGVCTDGPGRALALRKKMDCNVQRDFSLKEGEKIVVNVSRKGGRPRPSAGIIGEGPEEARSDADALFSIAPPPPAAGALINGMSMRHQRSSEDDRIEVLKTGHELGFDDDEFGEFQ